jgi:hypothetical protein
MRIRLRLLSLYATLAVDILWGITEAVDSDGRKEVRSEWHSGFRKLIL